MVINQATIDLVKQFEGCVLTAYPDPASKNDPKKKGQPWTIGYGHTGGMSLPIVKQGMTITQADADEYLANDLAAAAAIVMRYVKVEININQLGALASFTLNVGEGTFAKSSVLSYVNAGKFDSVPGRLALYRLANGKVMNGLVRRRQAEGVLWLTPVENEHPIETTETTNHTIKPDQNGKSHWDIGALGGAATLAASVSGSVRQTLDNITGGFGISAVWVILAVGLAFAGYTIWNKWKRDK